MEARPSAASSSTANNSNTTSHRHEQQQHPQPQSPLLLGNIDLNQRLGISNNTISASRSNENDVRNKNENSSSATSSSTTDIIRSGDQVRDLFDMVQSMKFMIEATKEQVATFETKMETLATKEQLAKVQSDVFFLKRGLGGILTNVPETVLDAIIVQFLMIDGSNYQAQLLETRDSVPLPEPF
eukprot:scaffold15108_cov180-Amphora_coffeaeformis.AAC.85